VKPQFVIPIDFPCFYCEYTLRGLEYFSNCPECGHTAKQTFKAIAAGLCPGLGQELEAIRAFWVKDIADAVGYPQSAILFVIDSQQMIQNTGNYDAVDICNAFCAYAKKYFNSQDEARDLLAEWKLNRSENLGRIIFALVEAGFVSMSPGDALSDFDGLFTIETLLTNECPTVHKSPLDVRGVHADLSMEEIIAYLREVRERRPPA